MKRALFQSFVLTAFIGWLMCSCSRQGPAPSAATGNAPAGSANTPGGAATGQANSQQPGPPMTFERPPMTDLRPLLTNDTEAFWTRTIDVSNVQVQRVFANGEFLLVGPDSTNTVVVQVRESHPEIKVGQRVDISGIIDPIGSISQWNVSPQAHQMLAGHTMFISGDSVKPAAKE